MWPIIGRYIHRAGDRYSELLALRHCEPSKVVVDPRRAFESGFWTAIFEGSRVRLADVAGMVKAGEDPGVVVEELGVSIDDVRTATRVTLGHAA